MRYGENMTNKNASALGKSRWANKTKEERAEHARMMARKYWDSVTPEDRAAHMERARKARKPKKASI